MNEPKINVGILLDIRINFSLSGYYLLAGTKQTGEQTVSFLNGKIIWNNHLFEELLFEPTDEKTDTFELTGVTIGIGFHWERKENQRFKGALKIVPEDEKLRAINIVPTEDYLTSVVSSEMSAHASAELLKAHAVISRSWVIEKLEVKKNKLKSKEETKPQNVTPDSLQLKWYDHEGHSLFDVCADDHCQRYQGITRAYTPQVTDAITATRGQVLTYEGKICDARFSKCCGGALEEFQYCWEETAHPYLKNRRDIGTETSLPDLRNESEAEDWIRTSPGAFCNTTEKKILSQVLNNYDRDTTDFYRWKITYNQDELSELILKRSGIDYGKILDLIPIARGSSGRIWKLKIIGTKRSQTIGKELEIRRTLSPSHLYSSAFVVEKEAISPKGIPARFILTGAGWGHGVGLCQIGAAVMGEQGYTYEQILSHYYTGANIQQLY